MGRAEPSLRYEFRLHDRDYVYDASTNNIYRAEEFSPDDQALRPVIADHVDIGPDLPAYETQLQHLCLTVTERCNLRCRYCLHQSSNDWIRPHRDRDMSPVTTLSAVDYFAAHSADSDRRRVSFYGGEPLLVFPLIRQVVEEAHRREAWRGLEFSITTNGTLLDEEMIAFITEHRIRLQISLDGPPSVHDRHRLDANDQPTHQRVEAGVRRLLQADARNAERLQFAVTVGPPYDFRAIDAYYADFPPFRDAGLAQSPQVTLHLADLQGVHLGPAAGSPQQSRRNLEWARKTYIRACAEDRRQDLGPALRHYFDSRLIKFHHRARGVAKTPFRPTGSCRPGLRKLHITVDGRLQPCESIGEGLVIGDLERRIDMRAVARLQDELLGAVRERCAACWAFRLCTVCFTAMAASYDADDPGAAVVPMERCDWVRADVADVLVLFTEILETAPGSLDFLAESVVS